MTKQRDWKLFFMITAIVSSLLLVFSIPVLYFKEQIISLIFGLFSWAFFKLLVIKPDFGSEINSLDIRHRWFGSKRHSIVVIT